jgi:hypothetical protein
VGGFQIELYIGIGLDLLGVARRDVMQRRADVVFEGFDLIDQAGKPGRIAIVQRRRPHLQG